MATSSTKSSQIDLMFRAFCDGTRLRILSLLQDGDLLLTMGAGDIGSFAATLPQRLSKKPLLKVQK